MGSGKDDLSAFPREVRDVFGQALFEAPCGETPHGAKPLAQFGPGVFELRDEHRGDAYRAVYTVRLHKAIYMLHAFKKKSKSGKAMPRQDVAVIEHRLRRARIVDQE